MLPQRLRNLEYKGMGDVFFNPRFHQMQMREGLWVCLLAIFTKSVRGSGTSVNR